MKVRLWILPILTLAVLFFACQSGNDETSRLPKEIRTYPAEDFYLARNYPDGKVGVKALRSALKEAKAKAQVKSEGFNEAWTVQGPGNIGARINTIAVNPQNENVIYVGFSTGGVWKTTDGGANWLPIFDEQTNTSIGDIALDPLNPEVVFVGTGDPNITGYPWIGNGLWKSPDGGQSWEYLGLEETSIISRIVIHPQNPDIIYVATMGLPFERNLQRGVYRSTDGGQSWFQVMFISDQAGVTDLQMDPFNPNTLYAAGWDRIRNNQESLITGPGARIWKSTNGGSSWNVLAGGLPTGNQGRPALALSKLTPGLVYARFVGTNSQVQGVYKSTNGGQSWSSLPVANIDGALGGFGWYFGTFAVHPQMDDRLYVLGVDLWEYLPDQQVWQQVGPPWWEYNIHADKHDLVFSPSGNMYLATDGGLYKSTDDGVTWTDIENIPTTQFYRVGYNPHQPDMYYGGAQDNGTSGGNAQHINEWERIYGGDGFQVAFHPEIAEVFYVETQNGNISVTDNGGYDFFAADDGIDSDDRRNWDMPYLISRHNPDVLYAGTYRLYKSTNGVYPLFEPISDDLTDGLVIHPRYHNITAISESPIQQGLLFVGTADGNIWQTPDDGATWVKISDDLPDRFVSDVVASPSDPKRVFAAHSGYKDNEFIPRLFRSDDSGTTWTDVSGDLPDLAINELFVMPGHADSVLFAATDGGVYATLDGGSKWHRLGSNMPFVPVYDLDLNVAFNQLIAGTHARSIMTYPLDSLLPDPDTSTFVFDPLPVKTDLRLYPNPANGQTIVSCAADPGKAATLVVLNTEGRVMIKRQLPEAGKVHYRLDLTGLQPGLYVVKVKTGNVVRTGKLLKR
ncbi:MAG: hypothetical protein Kow0027_20760 [Saprospiraceae bacterium]